MFVVCCDDVGVVVIGLFVGDDEVVVSCYGEVWSVEIWFFCDCDYVFLFVIVMVEMLYVDV